MKKAFLSFMLLTTPAMVASTITKQDIIKTVEHQRELVHQAEQEAATAKQELVVVQDAITAQTAKLHETQQELAVTKKELSDAKHHFHLLLLLCSSLIGFVVFAGIQRFSTSLLAFYPPALASDWIISISSGVLAGVIAWQFLAHL